MPAAPTPATALPMMNEIEFGAAPQIAEPTSKRKMDSSKMSFTLYME
jgi:hypothetical protein